LLKKKLIHQIFELAYFSIFKASVLNILQQYFPVIAKYISENATYLPYGFYSNSLKQIRQKRNISRIII